MIGHQENLMMKIPTKKRAQTTKSHLPKTNGRSKRKKATGAKKTARTCKKTQMVTARKKNKVTLPKKKRPKCQLLTPTCKFTLTSRVYPASKSSLCK